MIVRVKISPMERWCVDAVEHEGRKRSDLPGREVEIYADRMVPAPGKFGLTCRGRWWPLTNECANKLRALIGNPPLPEWDERGLCEHMLEMD